MPTQTGHLVLADISGYTAFVADTELEHSREILNELLETMVRCLGQHLTIGQIEGDAIFALGEKLPKDPVAWLEECFFRFHRHLNTIKQVSTCPCRACANVGILTLKFVCHYGEYMPQTFGNKQSYVGNAVNIVHRLLKNRVPSREYLLLTSAALERFPHGVCERTAPHREEYDLGSVDCAWMDLSPLRSDPRAQEEVRTVDEAHAQVRMDTLIDAPKGVVWRVLTDPAMLQRWLGVRRLDYKPGVRHTLVGGEYHCIHGAGQEMVVRIAEAVEPDRLTIALSLMGVLVSATSQLEEADVGGTRLVRRFYFEPPKGIAGILMAAAVRQLFRRRAAQAALAIARDAEDLAKRPGGPIPAGTS